MSTVLKVKLRDHCREQKILFNWNKLIDSLYRVYNLPWVLITLRAICTRVSLTSCCVCKCTLSRSRGCVQQAAKAEDNPPKYHRASLFSFWIDMIWGVFLCTAWKLQLKLNMKRKVFKTITFTVSNKVQNLEWNCNIFSSSLRTCKSLYLDYPHAFLTKGNQF